MIAIPFYQVDAFTAVPFKGNPAAVCLLQSWPDDKTLLAIAQENNLAETAFVVPEGKTFALRWFTPQAEVDLCGHATLATAHILYEQHLYTGTDISFTTRQAGSLRVAQVGPNRYRLDFPTRPANPVAAVPALLLQALGSAPQAVWANQRDFLALYPDAAAITALTPDMALLKQLGRWVCVSAPGTDCDFVSRFFTPGDGYDEDPVTGSTHTMLVPYWADRLGKTDLLARQLSPRGGTLHCTLAHDRVFITGDAVTVIAGQYLLPEHA